MRILEALWMVAPLSAKEIATQLGVLPDRIYYHLGQLEKAGLIHVSEYRPLAGGKVERMYQPTTVEPPSDQSDPLEVAQFLCAMLEATQADITAASTAKANGEQRSIHLVRTTLRINDEQQQQLNTQINELLQAFHEHPNEAGHWTRVLFTVIDLEQRT
jgi:predicted ArsR family transcriptional regulator